MSDSYVTWTQVTETQDPNLKHCTWVCHRFVQEKCKEFIALETGQTRNINCMVFLQNECSNIYMTDGKQTWDQQTKDLSEFNKYPINVTILVKWTLSVSNFNQFNDVCLSSRTSIWNIIFQQIWISLSFYKTALSLYCIGLFYIIVKSRAEKTL